ncbi:uncharacterized protein G2W53_033799 [Senna tora]|uniref:Uncharacterized protein n=1 Tax=Senna tora TaxID=362788 RepID=A0A834W8R8_9FABA|nr:uncharacterized protein G2W53_033799 [Senna tora]
MAQSIEFNRLGAATYPSRD